MKLIKSVASDAAHAFRVDFPADCEECAIVTTPAFHGENLREMYFHVRVPTGRSIVKNIRVDVAEASILAVIVEKNRIPFSKSHGFVSFDLPVAPRSRSSTLEVQTSLEWPGVVLRIEHAFEERRAGKYASGGFPSIQRTAALNLEFGLREAIWDLDLANEVQTRGLGKIHLMGFDTNNPMGHEDYPPHMHLILRWPHFAGSQAPHFYINDKGRLVPDVTVTLDGMPHIGATHAGKGAWLPAIDYLGETLYQTLVTDDGGIVLRRPGAASCAVKPIDGDDRGFASGAVVICTSDAVYKVFASDDTDRGELRVSVNSKPPEVYRYDVDTAVLLSSEPPLMDKTIPGKP